MKIKKIFYALFLAFWSTQPLTALTLTVQNSTSSQVTITARRYQERSYFTVGNIEPNEKKVFDLGSPCISRYVYQAHGGGDLHASATSSNPGPFNRCKSYDVELYRRPTGILINTLGYKINKIGD